MDHRRMDEAQVGDFLYKTKGAALSCLVAMLMLNRPIGVMEFIKLTNWKKDTIRDGLGSLELHGYATPLGRTNAWRLTSKGQQLSLPGLFQQLENGEGGLIALEGGKTALGSPVVVVDLLDNLKENQQQQQPARAEKSPSRKPETEVEQALADAGIMEPTRAELAADEWVTPDRVRRTAVHLRSSGAGTGMIVLNLRGHVEPPAEESAERDVGREWLKYMGGREEIARDDEDDVASEAEFVDPGEGRYEVVELGEFEPFAVDTWRSNALWQSILGELRMQMRGPTFETCLKGSCPVWMEDDVFVVAVRDVLAADWIEAKLAGSMARSLSGILNRPVKLRFVIAASAASKTEEME